MYDLQLGSSELSVMVGYSRFADACYEIPEQCRSDRECVRLADRGCMGPRLPVGSAVKGKQRVSRFGGGAPMAVWFGTRPQRRRKPYCLIWIND